MHTIAQNNIIYFYRDENRMLEAMIHRGSHSKMYSAEYAIELDPSSDYEHCKVLKDKYGFFMPNSFLEIDKVVKTIKLLME
jgi:hypothetical protein